MLVEEAMDKKIIKCLKQDHKRKLDGLGVSLSCDRLVEDYGVERHLQSREEP
jgi:hypothetical protein